MQKPTHHLLSLAILAGTLGLTACNSNDDTGQLAPGKKTVTVTPSLGRISNAHVRLLNAANLQEIGTQALVNGQAVFSVPASVAAVVAEVVPDANASYFDEATRQDEPFPAGTPLRAAFTLPNKASAVGITALTEAAVQRAQTLAGGNTQPLTPAQIGEANQLVNQAFGIDNILLPPVLVGNPQDFGKLVNDTAATRYALRLAALAQQAAAKLGAGAPSPAAAMAKALANDLADGKLDKQAGGAAIPNLPYGDPGQFKADLILALNNLITTVTTAAQSGLTPDQITKLTQLATTLAGSITIQPTPYVPPTCASMGLTAATSTAPVADFVGDFSVTINKTSGQSTGTLTVSANGNLTLGGATATARAICLAPPQANGTPLLILTSTAEAGSTHLAMANLFKDTAGVLSVEGMVFSGSEAGSYYGTKGGGSAGPLSFSSFTPSTAAVGDTVTLSGSGFGSDMAHLVVTFGTVAGEILSATDTQITVKVPAGAVTGKITVTNGVTNETMTSAATFTVKSGGTAGGWVAGTMPSSAVMYGIAYGNGKYVATGAGGAILTSTDGVSWTSVGSFNPNKGEIRSVIYDGTQFVLVGSPAVFSYPQTTAPRIAVSTDGVTWTDKTWAYGYETLLTDVALGGDRLTAVGANGTIITSTDGGSTWTSEAQQNNNATYITEFFGLAANGATRVAVGRNSAYHGVIITNTGSGWTPVLSDMTDAYPRDVVWNGSKFVAIGSVNSAQNSGAAAMISTDGQTWTRYLIDNIPAGYILKAITWSGSKFYAAGGNGGNGGVVMSSTDGQTWTVEHQSTASGMGDFNGIVSSGSAIMALGANRTVSLATGSQPAACTSTGKLDLLAYRNGPAGFCEFAKQSYILIPQQASVRFSAANQTMTVNVNGTSVDGVVLTDNVTNNIFVCGGASSHPCAGVTVSGSSTKTLTFSSASLFQTSGGSATLSVTGQLEYF